MKAFIENKCFHLADSREQAKAKLIEQWKKDGGIQKPESVFLLASTNAEVTDINRQAQAARIQAGSRLGRQEGFRQRGLSPRGRPRCLFLKKSKELAIDNGDMATVVRVDESGRKMTVRLDAEAAEKSRSISPDTPRIIWPWDMRPRRTRPKARQFPTSTS